MIPKTLDNKKYDVTIECSNPLGSIQAKLTIITYGFISNPIYYPESIYYLVLNKEIQEIIPKLNPDLKYKFRCLSNNLPNGLLLNEENGIISGIPTNKVTKQIDSNEINPNGLLVQIEYEEEYCIPVYIPLYFIIDEQPKLFKYTSNNEIIKIKRNKRITIIPNYDNNECVFEIVDGLLPSGIELNINNGTLSGTTFDTNHKFKTTIRCSNHFGFIDTSIEIELCILYI